MAELVVTQDELALRRRARRRLVGAVAIALTCVVALPMLFDSEPKPLGQEVDLQIPAQDTPFETEPAAAQPAPPETRPAEPTQPAPAPPAEPTVASKAGKPEAAARQDDGKPRPDKPPLPAAAEKPKSKPKIDVESKPKPKPDTSFAAQGYFLQIGAFGSEANARQLRDKAVAAGFKVVLTGANGQFRVRVGPVPQHDKALEMQTRLKAKGFSPVLLGP